MVTYASALLFLAGYGLLVFLLILVLRWLADRWRL